MNLPQFALFSIALTATLVAEPEPLEWHRFEVNGHNAFVLTPEREADADSIPWVFYAPTFHERLPNERDEGWMIRQILAAGIGVAGIDVGESYGSPDGRALFEALHRHVTTELGFSNKACLLARSRGGLMLYNWAVEHPEKVTCIAGIYPVCDPRSYPGLAKAAPAYQLSEADLTANIEHHNPVDRLASLAKAGVPIFHIHGDVDTVVPLQANSGAVSKAYQKLGGDMELVVPRGQGHSMWRGFFECQELVDFVIGHASGEPPKGRSVELLWAGGQFTEGPAAAPDGSLLFSDVGASRIYRYSPESGEVTPFRENSGRANGLIFDSQNQLIACEGANTGGGRRISLTTPDGGVRTLADSWQGKRFNSPNDLAMAPNGNIYFTDPRYVGDEERDLDFEGVFLIRPGGEVVLATKEVTKPNGILITADGRAAYLADHPVGDAGARQLLAFGIGADGKLRDKRVLHEFGASRGIDGMALDASGNIFATAGAGREAGIYIFEPRAGSLLKVIPLPGDPTNCTFGRGEKSSILYVTAEAPAGDERGGYGLYQIDFGKRAGAPE